MRKQPISTSITVAIVVVFLSAIGLRISGNLVRGDAMTQHEQQSAMINGTVFDHENQPLAGAEVIAVSSRPSIGRRPQSVTNAAGNFTIGGLHPGTYYIEAKKESEGYVSNRSSFASAGLAELPEITIAGTEILSGVAVRLGPKAARLTGEIFGGKNRAPVENAQIILRRSDNPNHFLSTGPNDAHIWNRFSILVPPRPFTVQVKAAGYEDWTYNDNGAHTLTLSSGQSKHLIISLQRK